MFLLQMDIPVHKMKLQLKQLCTYSSSSSNNNNSSHHISILNLMINITIIIKHMNNDYAKYEDSTPSPTRPAVSSFKREHQI
mmetsp:Transcript_23234/g.26461  ORF Transcript_23234/g.26461 Transcript_23234/m.26461 type:complete len:82 (+) Transcript_23234:1987-2232(+)